MFKNYLKIAFRNLFQHKAFSFINIVGLAIGIACCLLILLYVQHELQYDVFHEYVDTIFCVISQETRPNGEIRFSALQPTSLAHALKEEFPPVIRVTRVDHTFTRGRMFTTVRRDAYDSFNVRLIRTDPDYLATFGIELLSGRNFSEALSIDVHQSIVVNETLVKAFGLQAPVGKPLEGFRLMALKEPVIIGVVKDFHFDSLHRKIWPLIQD